MNDVILRKKNIHFLYPPLPWITLQSIPGLTAHEECHTQVIFFSLYTSFSMWKESGSLAFPDYISETQKRNPFSSFNKSTKMKVSGWPGWDHMFIFGLITAARGMNESL